jgi:hypothetical protein
MFMQLVFRECMPLSWVLAISAGEAFAVIDSVSKVLIPILNQSPLLNQIGCLKCSAPLLRARTEKSECQKEDVERMTTHQ